MNCTTPAAALAIRSVNLAKINYNSRQITLDSILSTVNR